MESSRRSPQQLVWPTRSIALTIYALSSCAEKYIRKCCVFVEPNCWSETTSTRCWRPVRAYLRGSAALRDCRRGWPLSWWNATCSLSSGPRVAFNSLATESERSEQTGLATIMKGLHSAFRNPTAHAPKIAWATSRADALDMLTIASMLHRRLDHATVRG
jgi:hypothetical protein